MYYLYYLYDIFLYDLYAKYDKILPENSRFWPISPTATNGYV
jgi:hypothetical protein